MNINKTNVLKKKIKNYFIKKRYKKFNKKFFKRNKKNCEILVEFNSFQSSHIFLSTISSVLSEKFDGKIVGYYNFCLSSTDLSSVYQKLKWYLGKFFAIIFLEFTNLLE